MWMSFRPVRARTLGVSGLLIALALVAGCSPGGVSKTEGTPGQVSDRFKKIQDAKAKAVSPKQ